MNSKYLRRAGLFALIVAVGACAGVASQQSTGDVAGDEQGDNDGFIDDSEDVAEQTAELNVGEGTLVTQTYKLLNVKKAATKSQTILIKNKYSSSVSVQTSIETNSKFVVVDNCSGKTLAKLATCTIVAKYTPTARTETPDVWKVGVSYTYTADGSTGGGATCSGGSDAGSGGGSDAGASDSGSDSGGMGGGSDAGSSSSDAGSTCTPNGASITVEGYAVESKALTVWPTGSGSGQISFSGKKCPTICKGSYDIKSGDAGAKKVVLTEKPSNDSVFCGWSAGCDGVADGGVNEAGTCAVWLKDDTKVTATFCSTSDAGSSSSDSGSDAASDAGASDAASD